MNHSGADVISVSIADLQAVEHVIRTRLAGAAAERQRAERMRRLVRVTSELTRALSTYARHALVHCQGTAGATDLSDDTRSLTDALTDFSREVAAVSDEYSTIVGAGPSEEAAPVAGSISSLPDRHSVATRTQRSGIGLSRAREA